MPKSQTIDFVNADGIKLEARLDHPAGAHRGWAIFAHCFTCSKDSLAAARVSQELAMEGIGVLRLDFTGLGQSEGKFEDTSFTSNLNDIIAASDWLGKHYKSPVILVGHSLGGAAVLAVAGKISSIKGVATIGAPADPGHVQHLFQDAVEKIKKDGVADVSIGGRPFKIGKQFIDEFAKYDAGKTIGSLKADLLVLHSPLDNIVGIDNASAIYTAAKHPKSYVSLDKADHLLTKREDSTFAAKVISAWASRCLKVPAVAAPSERDATVVQSSPDGPFAHDIAIGVHRLRADEPPSLPGGMDSGVTPYDFVKAGLGACTAMTVRMVADRKKIPLEGCRVEIKHDKDKEGRDVFSRQLILEGGLDDAQRKELLRIANKCPVHRTLENSSHIETKLADE